MVSRNQKAILNKMMLYKKGEVFTRPELSRELGINIQSVNRYLDRKKLKKFDTLLERYNRKGELTERVRFSHHFELIEWGNNILFRRK